MSKSPAFIMCHRKSKKRLLAGVSHSNIEKENEQIMVVLKMNCHSAELRIRRPEILFQIYGAGIMPTIYTERVPKQTSKQKKSYGETKTQRRK